jgi:hypothetical protein
MIVSFRPALETTFESPSHFVTGCVIVTATHYDNPQLELPTMMQTTTKMRPKTTDITTTLAHDAVNTHKNNTTPQIPMMKMAQAP